jgi:predicted enzyme related to lactoylglutathione lyase
VDAVDSTVAFEAVVPMVPAGPDMAAAVAFYEGKLGFARQSTGELSDTEMVGRGPAQLLLQRTDDAYWASQTTVRFRISDVDALYAEIAVRGVDRITAIMATPWGTREFHVVEPFGVCLHFYQRAPNGNPAAAGSS